MKTIVFTGGGSAGHVVPNIALMQDLKKYENITACYIGSNGLEKRLIQSVGAPYFEIECPKLIRSKSLSATWKNLRIPVRLFRAIRQAKQALKTCKPNVVFSKGGYVALPVVLAANKLKIPCYTHESDLSAGLANRLISQKCKATFTSFPETANTLKNGVYTGAPMREELFSCDKLTAKIKFGFPSWKKTILVLGGGSGSKIINDAIRANLPKLKDYAILHVCGKNNVVKNPTPNYRQYEYLENIGEAYAAADVVVSRAGAGATFEIFALKKPALFIPLEGQTRGDQVENAKHFEKQGLCKVLRQSNLNELVSKIEETLFDQNLAKNLARSHFESGNEKILAELLSAL